MLTNFLYKKPNLIFSSFSFQKLQKFPFSMIKKSYPAVFLDVDGVIKVGNEPIKKAKEAIELIR